MKSLHTKLNEALEKMTSKQRDKFFESRKSGDPVEVQVNCAEAILAGKVKESTPARKNNGATENFVEGSPFNEGRNGVTENNTQKDVCAKGDKVLADGLLKLGKITEAEHAQMVGAKPQGYEKLSEQQRKDFDFCRLIGISESDAFRLTKITGSTFREVSRR